MAHSDEYADDKSSESARKQPSDHNLTGGIKTAHVQAKTKDIYEKVNDLQKELLDGCDTSLIETCIPYPSSDDDDDDDEEENENDGDNDLTGENSMLNYDNMEEKQRQIIGSLIDQNSGDFGRKPSRVLQNINSNADNILYQSDTSAFDSYSHQQSRCTTTTNNTASAMTQYHFNSFGSEHQYSQHEMPNPSNYGDTLIDYNNHHQQQHLSFHHQTRINANELEDFMRLTNQPGFSNSYSATYPAGCLDTQSHDYHAGESANFMRLNTFDGHSSDLNNNAVYCSQKVANSGEASQYGGYSNYQSNHDFNSSSPSVEFENNHSKQQQHASMFSVGNNSEFMYSTHEQQQLHLQQQHHHQQHQYAQTATDYFYPASHSYTNVQTNYMSLNDNLPSASTVLLNDQNYY